jgi:hypothetical protein
MSQVFSSLESPDFATLRFRPWREMAIIFLLLMELSWVVPWFRALTAKTYAAPSWRVFVTLLGMSLIAYYGLRFINYLHLRSAIRQSLMLGLLIISILLGLNTLLYAGEALSILEIINRPLRSMADWSTLIPDEFVVILAILIGWWRGISLAQVHIGPQVVQDYFRLGIIMYVLFVFMNTLATGETPGLLLYLFFLSGMVAMSTARMSILHTLRGGRQNIFDRGWLIGIVMAALLIDGLVFVVGWMAGGQAAIVGAIILSIFGFVAVLAWLIFSPILAVLIWIIRRLPGLSNTFENLTENLEQFASMMRNLTGQFFKFLENISLIRTLKDWAPILKSAALWGILILFAAGILTWVAFRLWQDRDRRKVLEELQSLIRGGDIWKMLLTGLNQHFANLLGQVQQVFDLRSRQRQRAANRIRQIYADLLNLCAELNHPRPNAITPLEFIPILNDLFPNQSTEIGVITHAYNQVRYGQVPEIKSDVEEIEQAWLSVKAQGVERVKAEKRRGRKASRDR